MTNDSPLILVVDDERHICTSLRRILKKEGYRVITAHDGDTAIQRTQRKKPDVILLDIMMPGINGREVCRRIRESCKDIQIIYFSAKSELTSNLISKGLYDEADAFIAKPATGEKILSRVNSVLQGCRK